MTAATAGFAGTRTGAARRSRARRLVDRYTEQTVREKPTRTLLSEEALDYQAGRAAEAAERLGRPGCLVLQDPTGTGKTVVALVAALLLLDDNGNRGVDRVLVVAPNQNVAEIWKARAIAAGFAETDIKVATMGRLRWSTTHRLLIATRTSMPSEPLSVELRQRLLVIVDEAHRGMEDPNNRAFDEISALAADGRVLLVTATPFQLSASAFAQMLEIATRKAERPKAQKLDRLAINAYGDAVVALLKATRDLTADAHNPALQSALDIAADREAALRPGKDAALSSHLLSAFDREKMGLPEHPTISEPQIIHLNEEWRTFYHVARILPELVEDARSSDSYVRMLGSSHEAFLQTDVFKEFELAYPRSPLRHQLVDIATANRTRHPKVSATADWVVERLCRGRHVLVFCVYKATQDGLLAAIRERLPADATVMKADNAQQAKRAHERQFRFPPGGVVKPLALIIRDNLSEAIDLDGGEPSVVHHDLTWNPARFAQRMGRITRASSNFWSPRREDVFIPVLDLELDRRLYDTMTNRARLADHVLAALPRGADDWADYPPAETNRSEDGPVTDAGPDVLVAAHPEDANQGATTVIVDLNSGSDSDRIDDRAEGDYFDPIMGEPLPPPLPWDQIASRRDISNRHDDNATRNNQPWVFESVEPVRVAARSYGPGHPLAGQRARLYVLAQSRAAALEIARDSGFSMLGDGHLRLATTPAAQEIFSEGFSWPDGTILAGTDGGAVFLLPRTTQDDPYPLPIGGWEWNGVTDAGASTMFSLDEITAWHALGVRR
jgi:superfamily II DNA or RNA helicase